MNLGQLQAAIQNLGYGTDTLTQQTYAINAAYREIVGLERWPFLEVQDQSLTTQAGIGGYVLPMANWRQLDAVRIEVTGQQLFANVKYMEPQDFRDHIHIDRDTTTPFYWTWMNNLLQFYPIPDMSYMVTIDYIIEPPDLKTGTDVPLIPIQYHDMLVWGAVEYIAFRERDWLGRQFAEQRRMMMVTQMKEEYLVRQRQTSSHVKQSGYWNTQLPYPFVNEGF